MLTCFTRNYSKKRPNHRNICTETSNRKTLQCLHVSPEIMVKKGLTIGIYAQNQSFLPNHRNTCTESVFSCSFLFTGTKVLNIVLFITKYYILNNSTPKKKEKLELPLEFRFCCVNHSPCSGWACPC